MKKSITKRLKNWKIGDYVRQFSIVAGGVLLTLWLTGYIAEASKQREVRQAMQLVMLELHNNQQTIQDYEQIHNDEKRMALRLQAEAFSTKNFPADTVMLYQQRLYGGLAKPFRFSTDALEMLKTSGLTPHMTDKQLVLDLLNCYGQIEAFDKAIDLYFNMRKDVLIAYDEKHLQTTMPIEIVDYITIFEETTADANIKNWLCTVPRTFDTVFFEKYKTNIEETIAKLETAYQ